MPYHRPTNISCSVYPLDHPTHPVGLPAQEHHVHLASSSITGAIQQIATIESTPDTTFEISVELEPTSYSLAHRPESPDEMDDFLIFIILDGVEVQRSKRHRSQRGPTKISGCFTDDGRSRKFQFAKLTLVDPDDPIEGTKNEKIESSMCMDEKICQALGTIQVNIVRCQLSDKRPINPRSSNSNNNNHRRPGKDLKTTNQMTFSERTKKVLLSDTAGLSEASVVANGNRSFNGTKRSVRSVLWKDKNPFLQFIFEYSSKAVLEAKGIIVKQTGPPPPPPPPRPLTPGANLTNGDSKKRVTSGSSKLKEDASTVGHGHGSYLDSLATGGSSRLDLVDEQKPKKPIEYISIDLDDDDEPKKPILGSSRNSNSKRVKTEESTDNQSNKKEKTIKKKEEVVTIDLTMFDDSDSD